jgi:hypothetical protein
LTPITYITSIKAIGVLMGREPRTQVLSPGRLHVEQARAPEDCHEDLCLFGLAGRLIDDLHRVSGEVDEHPLAGSVAEAHHDVFGPEPLLVVRAELGVTPTVGVGLFPFEPQQSQGDVVSLALELAMDLAPIGDRATGDKL